MESNVQNQGAVQPARQVVETLQEAVTASRPRMSEGIILTAIFHLLMALPGLLIGLIILVIPIPAVVMSVNDPLGLTASLVGLGLAVTLFFVSGVLYILAGVGLLRGWNWARWLAIGLAMLMCLCVPVGTLIGVVILLYLLSNDVRQAFAG